MKSPGGCSASGPTSGSAITPFWSPTMKATRSAGCRSISSTEQGNCGTGEERVMAHSRQGIVKDKLGQEQPADKKRAQTVHKTHAGSSITKEATRDAKLSDGNKTPGSG